MSLEDRPGDHVADCGCRYDKRGFLVDICEEHARDVLEDEADYGGAFDGVTVTSDADPGL